MVRPVSGNDGGSKATSWVHAGTGEIYGSKVSKSDGEANGKRAGGLGLGSVRVADAKDCQDQDETQEDLNAEALKLCQLGVDQSVAETTFVNFFWSDGLKS